MTSKEDDDTLPLTRFSSELTLDASVDEDFIPTSQPQSIGSVKSIKENVRKVEKCGEDEGRPGGTTTPEPSLSTTDPNTVILSTLDQSPEEDQSVDFIPDTETKKRKFDYFKEKEKGKKKLREESFVKCTEDIFESESDSSWKAEVSKVSESGLSKCGSRSDVGVLKKEKNDEECITEIIVNDSAETVDLDGSENLSLLRKKKKEKKSEPSARTSVSCSLNSDLEKCEESQLFDNSSILLLDEPEVSCSKFGGSQSSVISTKLYLEETVEDKEYLKDKNAVSESECALTPATVKMPKESSTEDSTTELVDTLRQNENFNFKFENRTTSNMESSESSYVETRKVEMKLSVSCMVTANMKTKQVLQKLILSVNELSSCKPKPKCLEPNSDSASDKSKRQSTSSSGSVYSDKTGLPFALPKRVSAISDQTDASDSSDEWFSKRLRDGQKVFERMPWTNEYLLPLKMDELIKVPFEKQEILPSTTNMPSPKKFKPWNRNELNHIEEISESSSFEHASVSDTRVADSKSAKLLKAGFGKFTKKDEGEDLKAARALKQIEEISQNAGCEESDKAKNSECREKEETMEKGDSIECRDKQVGKIEEQEDSEREKVCAEASEEKKGDADSDSVEFGEGLPVFARWTDKRYYSGVLCGTSKNYRWDIKFDDGTTKTIREEFLMPTKWLKVGELVFALVDDKYQSGQIAQVECGENETNYVVELDSEKKGVTVKVSDLCLSEVMANIVRERHKPLSASPRGKVTSDINFDNVVIGKRVREQRTPLRTAIATSAGNSGTDKKSSNVKKREIKLSESQEASAQDNTENKISSLRESGNKSNGLISEKGHLVEDKVISGDSPSRNETNQTCKRTRGKAKPRSLFYEPAKDRKEDKLTSRDWVTAEGIPIPGPSGIKFKTRKEPGSKKLETVQGFVEAKSSGSGESPVNERFNWKNLKAAESKKSRSVEKSKRKKKG